MVDVTFLELHLDDSNLTANAPYSDRKKRITSSDDAPAEGGRASKGSAVAALIGLVFLVAVTVVVKRKFLGGDGDEAEETVDVGGIEA